MSEEVRSKYPAKKPQPIPTATTVQFDSARVPPSDPVATKFATLSVVSVDSGTVMSARSQSSVDSVGVAKPPVKSESGLAFDSAPLRTVKQAATVDSAFSETKTCDSPMPSMGGDIACSGPSRPPAAEEKLLLERLVNFQGLPASCAGKAQVKEAAATPQQPSAQLKELMTYKAAVSAAVHLLAFSGSADKAMSLLVRRCPQVQLATDNPRYMEIPLGQAVLRGHTGWAREFLASAEAAGIGPEVLAHRNSARHTLLMLAVDLIDSRNSEGSAEEAEKNRQLLVKLLASRPAQVHECYDVEGRNVLHHCAADNRPEAFRLILAWLADNAPDCAPHVAEALKMPDGRCRTPIHYIAESGSLSMLTAVKDFAERTGINVDFNWRWRVAFDYTPLDLAEKSGHKDVADLLMKLAPPQQQKPDGAGVEDCDDVDFESDDCGFEEDEDEDDDDDEFKDDAGECKMETDEAAAPVSDLSRLSSAARAHLCEGLREAKKYDEFLGLLKSRVPSLTANNPGFLELSADPVFLSISLMAGGGAPEASCGLLAELLAQVGLKKLADKLMLAPIPGTDPRSLQAADRTL